MKTKNASFPEVLFTSSTNDDRVHPAHARKIVAKLQKHGYAASTFLVENIQGGHGGGSNAEQHALSLYLEYQFFWKNLSRGLEKSIEVKGGD